MSEKRCIGCGAVLQNKDPEAVGYAVSLDMDYCQRCFRMIHYDKHVSAGVVPLNDLEHLKGVKGTFVWIMDVMDIETSLDSAFVDFFRDHYCFVVVNKCDLLPETVGENKIRNFVLDRLKRCKTRVIDIVLRGMKSDFRSEFRKKISDRVNDDLVMVGVANVGKSTVINDLLGKEVLTVNRHPSTTLQFNYINSDYGRIVDSVGLVDGNSVQAYLHDSDLKKIVPNRRIRPTIYQLKDDQTISIGGFARVDLFDCKNVTVVCYVSNLCTVQRNATKNADKLWNEHMGRELRPVLKNGGSFEEFKKTDFPQYATKRDICIEGAGWLCISGSYSHLEVYSDKRIKIRNRKAMI